MSGLLLIFSFSYYCLLYFIYLYFFYLFTLQPLGKSFMTSSLMFFYWIPEYISEWVSISYAVSQKLFLSYVCFGYFNVLVFVYIILLYFMLLLSIRRLFVF